MRSMVSLLGGGAGGAGGTSGGGPTLAPVAAPLAVNICGLPAPVLLTVIVAVRVPSEVGLNTTENLHVAVAAIELHVFDTINSPLSLDTPRTSTDCPPTLI